MFYWAPPGGFYKGLGSHASDGYLTDTTEWLSSRTYNRKVVGQVLSDKYIPQMACDLLYNIHICVCVCRMPLDRCDSEISDSDIYIIRLVAGQVQVIIWHAICCIIYITCIANRVPLDRCYSEIRVSGISSDWLPKVSLTFMIDNKNHWIYL